MQNLELKEMKNPTAFRKIAYGTWDKVKDPSVYGMILIDMSKANAYMAEYQKRTGLKITPTHLVGRAAALCMKKRPEINSIIRCNKIYLRQKISLFFQVNVPGRKSEKSNSQDSVKGDEEISLANVSGCVLHDAGDLSVGQLQKAMSAKIDKIREGTDKEFAKNMNVFKFLPWWASGYYLDFASWLIYGLNLDLSFLGIPKDPFGSIMITNVGSLGIEYAWAPLCPYTRVPLLLSVGAIHDQALVVDGQVVARPVMPVCITFDHRLMDGIHASQLSKEFRTCFNDPERYFGFEEVSIK